MLHAAGTGTGARNSGAFLPPPMRRRRQGRRTARVQPQTILIDGYNVIRRTPALAAAERQSLAGGRDALLTALSATYRHTAHRVVVVFDGDGAAETSEAHHGCRGNVI